MAGSIRLVGMDVLQAKLKGNANMDDVKRIVKHNGAVLTQTMKRQTTKSYVKGYSTGDTAGSINLEMTDAGLTARVSPTTNYSPYVEWGTRHMEAEPIVQPSLAIVGPKFLRDIERIIDK